MTAATASSLAGICRDAVQAECGVCWCGPGNPCNGADGGVHVGRLARAERKGAISRADLMAVLDSLDALNAAAVIRCEIAGAA
jgi:hypothetical protein